MVFQESLYDFFPDYLLLLLTYPKTIVKPCTVSVSNLGRGCRRMVKIGIKSPVSNIEKDIPKYVYFYTYFNFYRILLKVYTKEFYFLNKI
jgi:hypothetical protein